MPLGKDVGRNIRELKSAHPEWSAAHRLAASLRAARQAGNATVKPAPKPKSKGGKK